MSQILIPGVVYDFELTGPRGAVGHWSVHNLVPQEAIDYFANLVLGTGGVVADWYLGVFENDYVPTAATTAAILPTTIGETSAYDELTRPEWQAVYDGTFRLDNTANRAEFTFNQDKTLYGSFLVSDATKLSGSGRLLSIARYPSPKQIESGSVLRVRAGLELIAG